MANVMPIFFRFRLAMPQVFIDKIDAWKNKDLKTAEYICLDRNYRSREKVLDCINYLFERTMSKETGDIDYDNEQSLKAGAEYPETDEVPMEISLLI